MLLSDVHQRAWALVKAVHVALGVPASRLRWPRAPTVADLDHSVVSIRKVHDDAWEAFVDLHPNGDEWLLFDMSVKASAVAALHRLGNLREVARTTGMCYSTLWRAKNGGDVPEPLVDRFARPPHVVVLGPYGPLVDEPVVLTWDEAVGLLELPTRSGDLDVGWEVGRVLAPVASPTTES